jgi:hypothetical protein
MIEADQLGRHRPLMGQRGQHARQQKLVVAVVLEPKHQAFGLCRRVGQRIVFGREARAGIRRRHAEGVRQERGAHRQQIAVARHRPLAVGVGHFQERAHESGLLQLEPDIRAAADMQRRPVAVRRGRVARDRRAGLVEAVEMRLQLRPAWHPQFPCHDMLRVGELERRDCLGEMRADAGDGIRIGLGGGGAQLLRAAALLFEVQTAVVVPDDTIGHGTSLLIAPVSATPDRKGEMSVALVRLWALPCPRTGCVIHARARCTCLRRHASSLNAAARRDRNK